MDTLPFTPGAGIAISSSPGSMLIPTDKADQKQSCICKNKNRCKLLSKCYMSIGDVRGRLMQMPSLDNDRLGSVKNKKVERICDHLNIPRTEMADVVSVDKRDQSTAYKTPSKSTRAKKEKGKVKRVRKFIAVHHFHPVLIQEMVNEERANIDLIDRELIKATGLLGNGYTEEDRFKGKVGDKEVDVYVAAPSYSLEDGERDYELASSRYRLNVMIKSCARKYRGETFLTKGDAKNQTSKDPPQPVGKQRKLDSNDPKDLQRAVCLLSDRVSELEQRVKLLHNELMWERFQRRRSTLMLRASLYSSEYDGGMT